MEASGKSLPEAKEIVLDLLGVAEDDAEFVILSEPKAGLFGRVRGEARVQARVRPVAPPPKRGRRQRPDRAEEAATGRERGSSGGKGGPGAAIDREGGRADNGSGRAQRATAVGGQPGIDRPSPEREASGGADGRVGPVRSSQSAEGRIPVAAGDRMADSRSSRPRQGSGQTSGDSEDTMEESLTLEQQGEAATEFVAGLVREFGLDADVDFVELDEDTVQVAAAGDDLGLLVGPRGATLSAVQDLTRTFVQRQSEMRTDRILVDVGGYREKRAAALRRFTEGIVARGQGLR